MDPANPSPGERAQVAIEVHNPGPTPAKAIRLTDRMLQGAEIRNAAGAGRPCTVSPSRADCDLGLIGPGATATAQVTLLVSSDPVPRSVTQRIEVSSATDQAVATRGVSTHVAGNESTTALQLGRPATTVTVATTVGLVLAARNRGATAGQSPRRQHRS